MKCWFSLRQSHILYTLLSSVTQNNNLSSGEVAGIVVSVLIGGAILSKIIYSWSCFTFLFLSVTIFALIIVVSIKWHKNHDKSGNNDIDITTLKSFTVEPSNEETDHECVFSNQDVDKKVADQSDN